MTLRLHTTGRLTEYPNHKQYKVQTLQLSVVRVAVFSDVESEIDLSVLRNNELQLIIITISIT